jgi:hypothetical protein
LARLTIALMSESTDAERDRAELVLGYERVFSENIAINFSNLVSLVLASQSHKSYNGYFLVQHQKIYHEVLVGSRRSSRIVCFC